MSADGTSVALDESPYWEYAKQLAFPLGIPDALDGTKSSHNWERPPGGVDRLNTRAVFPSSNDWDIPDLPHSDLEPTALVAYNDPKAIAKAPNGAAVHFFLDDYRFETTWRYPLRGLERIATVGAALAPDFSMWRDMPLALQLYQVYRSRWCGLWLLACGIDVIPTVSWSTPRTFEFAFAGLTEHTTVALSTVGWKDDIGKTLFAAGCTALREQINPQRILVYGKDVDALFPDTEITYYPTRWG